MANAQPVPLIVTLGLRCLVSRTVRRATGDRLRKGYAPRPRRKCCCIVSSVSWSSLTSGSVGAGACECSASFWSEVRGSGDAVGSGGSDGESSDDSRTVGPELMRAAMALAMTRFKSGGYAACDAEGHPFSLRFPPTWAM
eukprot:3973902-Pleurochrysis_carterae.AAC.1